MTDPHHALATLALAEPAYAEPGSTLRQLARLMTASHVHAVLVRRRDGGLGLVSEADVVAALADSAGDPDSVWAVDVMSRDVLTVEATQPCTEAARRMLDAGVRHLVVTDHGEVSGMLAMPDLLRCTISASHELVPTQKT